MPTLMLEVPAKMLADLEEKANDQGRSLDEEALDALHERVMKPKAEKPSEPEPRGYMPGPVFISEELLGPWMVAPFMLTLPPGVPLKMEFVGAYQPDWDSLFREFEGNEG